MLSMLVESALTCFLVREAAGPKPRSNRGKTRARTHRVTSLLLVTGTAIASIPLGRDTPVALVYLMYLRVCACDSIGSIP